MVSFDAKDLAVASLRYRNPISWILNWALHMWRALLPLHKLILTSWVDQARSWRLLALWVVEFHLLVVRHLILVVALILVQNHVWEAVVVLVHVQKWIWRTSTSMNKMRAIDGIAIFHHQFILMLRHSTWVLFELCLSSLVITLHHVLSKCFSLVLLDNLVCAHPVDVHLLLTVLVFRLLDSALFKIIVHQLVAFV